MFRSKLWIVAFHTPDAGDWRRVTGYACEAHDRLEAIDRCCAFILAPEFERRTALRAPRTWVSDYDIAAFDDRLGHPPAPPFLGARSQDKDRRLGGKLDVAQVDVPASDPAWHQDLQCRVEERLPVDAAKDRNDIAYAEAWAESLNERDLFLSDPAGWIRSHVEPVRFDLSDEIALGAAWRARDESMPERRWVARSAPKL